MTEDKVIDISSQNTLREHEERVNAAEKILEEMKLERRQAQTEHIQAKYAYSQCAKIEKEQRKKEMDAAKTRLDLLENKIKLQEQEHKQMIDLLEGYRASLSAGKRQENSVKNVVACLEKLNANYVASDSKWYCIYSNGYRFQPQVRILHETTMRDLILCETGWVETQDLPIKKIAREAGRMYRDVERTFHPARPGVLNQMEELRKFWLQPIYGHQPHPAFDLLFSNLVDGDETYKNQIEKYIAYRYVKPEDINAPSIDSSAKGGAGRDTVFRILEIIFTEECCSEANGETFSGTHNGELWGKVWIKISERDARSIEYNQFKNLTGSDNFRLRRMNENAITAPRTFVFFIMNNGYNGTIVLQGTGVGSEDRRVEPIISNTSLRTRIADHFGLDENDGQVTDILQDWQTNVWRNETEIARWLGHIIDKHRPQDIMKLTPLHAQHYTEMFARQKNAFNTFMDNIVAMSMDTNCYVVDDMHKIYTIATQQKIDKVTFGKRMAAWLTQKSGVGWQVKVRSIYYETDAQPGDRHRKSVVYVPEQVQPGSHESKQVFDVYEFINEDQYDDKGKALGRKPHINNIKSELL